MLWNPVPWVDFFGIHLGFNPCFSGLCFGTSLLSMCTSTIISVLILVLVDYALELS